VLSVLQSPMLVNQPLSAVRDCSVNISSKAQFLEPVSFIRNKKIRLEVVKRDLHNMLHVWNLVLIYNEIRSVGVRNPVVPVKTPARRPAFLTDILVTFLSLQANKFSTNVIFLFVTVYVAHPSSFWRRWREKSCRSVHLTIYTHLLLG
jgi:hypothetical protein